LCKKGNGKQEVIFILNIKKNSLGAYSLEELVDSKAVLEDMEEKLSLMKVESQPL
jgi:hypothetical protein